jgi:tetratricopeptide (TPR) repeat protein
MIRYEQVWNAKGINDLFGLSDYFGFPYFSFLVLARAGDLIGGIDIFHQRSLHALWGIFIVLLTYPFYRTLGLKRNVAFIAAVIMCFSHALVGISRLAFRDNVSLLLELPALALLFRGLTANSLLCTFLGASLAGLEWYGYFPGRITAPLSLLYLAVLYILQRRRFSGWHLLKHATVYAFAFTITVSPLAMSYLRDQDLAALSNTYQRIAWLWYPEGQHYAMDSTRANTLTEALLLNALYGLSTFNNTLSDHGWKYCNHGHGFVDPLTGVLLWIGFFSTIRLLRRQPATALIVTGFAFELLSFSLLISQTPNYTRLLVILPFSVYLTAYGIVASAQILSRLAKDRKRIMPVRRGIATVLVLAVCLWNVYIYGDYVICGIKYGDCEGSIARYLEARKQKSNHLFIIVNGPSEPVFDKLPVYAWADGSTPFISPEQIVLYFAPADAATVRLSPPFTLFMTGAVWEHYKNRILEIYPKIVVHNLWQKTGLVALEDDSPVAADRKQYAGALAQVKKLETEFHKKNFALAQKLCQSAIKQGLLADYGSDCAARLSLIRGLLDSILGKTREAIPYFQRAVDLRASFASMEDETSLRYLDALGDGYSRAGDEKAAEKIYRELLQLAQTVALKDLCSPPPQELFSSSAKLASALAKQGRMKEAETQLRQIKGFEPHQMVRTIRDCAYAELKALNIARGMQLLKEAAAIRIETRDDDLAQVHADLGYCYIKLQEYDKAADQYSEAVKISTDHCKMRDDYEGQIAYSREMRWRQINLPKALR